MPQNAMPQKRPEDMSIEELESEVLARAQVVSDLAEQRFGVGFGAATAATAPTVPPEALAEEPAPAPMVEPVPGEPEPTEEPPLGVEGVAPPEVVMSATALLAEAGLLAAPSETLTPEVLSVLVQIAEQFAPGLYDMGNPAHVTEVLDGIINGTIPIGTSVPEPGPGPEPEPEPEPEPARERPSGLPYGGIY